MKCLAKATLCAFVSAAIVTIAGISFANDMKGWNHDCQLVNWDVQIDACTDVIESGEASEYLVSVALNYRGRAYYSRGDLDRALLDYNRSIEINPKYAVSLRNRGELHYDRGDLDRALADLARATEIAPKYSTAWNLRCFFRGAKNRDLPLALADCHRALQLRPYAHHILDSRALVYLQLKQFQEALADYDAAVKLGPNRAHYLFGRGIARLRIGDTAGAEKDFASANQIDSEIAKTYEGYGLRP